MTFALLPKNVRFITFPVVFVTYLLHLCYWLRGITFGHVHLSVWSFVSCVLLFGPLKNKLQPLKGLSVMQIIV